MTMLNAKDVAFTPYVYNYTIVGLLQWIIASINVTFATKTQIYVSLEARL